MDNEPENTRPIFFSSVGLLTAAVMLLVGGIVIGVFTEAVYDAIYQQPQFDALQQQARQSQLDLETTKSEYKQRNELANKEYEAAWSKIAQQQNEIDELKQQLKEASAKTGTPTTRMLLEQNAEAIQMVASTTTSLALCVDNLDRSNSNANGFSEILNQCLSSWRDSRDSCAAEYSEINNENGILPLLDVIRQHALAVGLENLTLADDGLVYEGEPDGNGALFFRDCSDDEHGCQEMAIETTVYSTDPTAELFLDKPVNLNDVDF